MIPRKLIVEAPFYDFEVIKEDRNKDADPRYYVRGPYMQYGKKNKNGRVYLEEEMIPEVERFITEMVSTGRAGGELGHSNSPDVDLKNLCHKIISLEQDGDTFIGKSMVLSSPSGKIYESLLRDGVKTGMSTKALGQIQEGTDGNIVRDLMLLAVDAVYDPSFGDAFVNGILENKEFIVRSNGKFEESYDRFEKKISSYPSKDRDAINKHIQESVERFLRSLKNQ